MSISLTVTAGPHVGRTFTFEGHDTFLVGRSTAAHFSLPDDPYFSRMHFLIEVNPPLCRLTDLNSRNGTMVNAEKVPAADLLHGDLITGGRTMLRLSVSPVAERATLELPAEAAPVTVPPSSLTDDDRSIASGLPLVLGYRLLAEVGRGGMGVVYRGVCEADGSEVAIKLIRPAGSPEPTAVARFLREAAVLKELRHPHIVGFKDSGEAHELLFFVMDFISGVDAAQLVASEGLLSVERTVGLGLQLLEALAYAHGKGFVHRDVKPANLLVTGQPGAENLHVVDFGLARTYQESALSGLTLSGSVGGTPHFMPPEQVTDFRRTRPEADQYSAAATLYHLLTGCFVYDGGRAAELFRKILVDEPVPLRSRRSNLPKGLAEAIHRALARRPEDRYPNTEAFAKALQPFSR